MIYSLYEKIIEITEDYKLCDYIAYLAFIVFVIISSLSAVVYAQGKFSLSSNKLSYTVTSNVHEGNLLLPPIDVSCASNEDITISFKIKVSNFQPGSVLDISVLDRENHESTHQFKRLQGDSEVIIDYSQSLGDLDLDSVFDLVTSQYPYRALRVINMHGEFNQDMKIEFYKLGASSKDHGVCSLKWIVNAN